MQNGNGKKPTTKIFAFILAIIMLAGIVPTQVFAQSIDEPLSGETGSGWTDFGGDPTDKDGSSEVTIIDHGGDKEDKDPDNSDGSSKAPADKDAVSAEDLKSVDDTPPVPEGQPVTLGASGDKVIFPYAANLKATMDKPQLFDATGVQGVELYWVGGDITFVNHKQFVGSGYLFRITHSGGEAFCAEWNGQKAGGTYLRTGEGSNPQIKQIVANYEASAKGQSEYIAAQVGIWAIITGNPVASWGGSNPNMSILSGTNSTANTHYFMEQSQPPVGPGHTQNIFTFTDSEIPTVGIKIIKKNADGSQTLAGGKFEVKGPNNFAFSGTTNASGQIDVSTATAYGIYTVTETVPPPGYKISSPSSKTIELTAAKPNGTVEFRNEKEDEEDAEYEIKVIKRVEGTNEALAGATFTVRHTAHGVIGTLTTNSAGQASMKVKWAGTYLVEETGVPAGYLMPDDPDQDAYVDNLNPVATLTFFNTPYTGVEVKKIDSKTGVPLPGATIKIQHISSGASFTRVTGSDGVARFTNAEPGSYYVQEIKAPEGYVLNETRYTVELRPNETASVTIPNDPWTGIKVIKKDAATGQLLAGAVVRVKHITSGMEYTETTAADGVAYFGPVPPGSYSVQEIQPPFGYTLNDTVFPVELTFDQIASVTIRNDRKAGLWIKKVDPNGKPIAGATFELRRGSGQVILREVTNDNGIIFRGLLTTDTYVIEEIQAPEGYLLDTNNPQSIFIDEADDNKEYVVTFVNQKKPSIEIIKVDADNPSKLLANAHFRISRQGGSESFDIYTDSEGRAKLENLEVGITYVIEEIKAPDGYVISDQPITIVLEEGKNHTVTFTNSRKPGLKIIKKDADTGQVLFGATFTLSWNGGASSQDFTTDVFGEAVLEGLLPGTYTLKEIKAPNGYILDDTERTVIMKDGEDMVIEITNSLEPKLRILKKDKATGAFLSGGATFRITWNDGNEHRDVTTNIDGIALVEGLKEGWYTIVEIKAPDGYLLDDTPHQIKLIGGKTAEIEIFDEKKPSLTLLKIDNITKTPLANAKFRIEKKTDTGNVLIGEFISDEDGIVYLENIIPGRYLVTEIMAPDGYNIDITSHEVTIEFGQAYQLEFTNTAKSPIYIQKVDEQGNPLRGAEFRITTMNGALVGSVTTGLTGYAILPFCEPGWYIVEEIKAPDGYILNNTPINIEVKSGFPAQVQFVNEKKPALEILKLDASTQKALMGAKFKVTKVNGELVGEYSSDANGLVRIEGLEAGSYIITEIRSPDGYILDITPQTVQLDPGKTIRVEFYNTGKPGLQLLKKDKITGLPVGGAMFSVVELIGATKKDHGTFTTGENGMFYIPDLTPGNYVITEIKAAPGYILDPTPKNIFVEGGKLNTVEFYNIPYSDLRLIKISADDERKPLEGAIFKLFDEKRLEVGTYTSSALGEIYVTGLPSGKYFLQEVKAPAGYVLDSTVREIELIGGKTTTVEWKNKELGSLKIIKVDEDTGKPLYGATFLLYDSKNNVLGEFTTTQDGTITFGRSLQAGKYTVKEIKAPDGYVLNDKVHSITITDGATTEIKITNKLKVGIIQIVKVADSNNPLTKHKKGDGLKGAVFQIYDEKSLDIVDEIETDSNGIAKSKELPLGRYAIKEIKAPKYYLTDGEVFYADIKVAGDIIRFKIENTPEEIEVDVTKRGIVETMAGEVFDYKFSDIANLSNCSLEEFYWHDKLPTDAIRIESLNTGTWNERGTYEVWVRTNIKGWKRIKTRLNTNVEYTVDMRRSALGLAANEYVTEFKLVFGEVEAGFTSKKDPFVRVRVNNGLPQGYRFVNKTDVGGRRGKEWVYEEDSWITVVFVSKRPKLPKTGGPELPEGVLQQ